MTGWPYENGKPLRCSRCGCAPAIRLADRTPGRAWCREHLPWLPTAPLWWVGRCRTCGSAGALVVDSLGRIRGPVCRRHRPAPMPFTRDGDSNLEIAISNLT